MLDEIQFADAAIGKMVAELKSRGRYQDTAIIITAKHGQSPIDPQRLLRIPADAPSDQPPSGVLGSAVVQALEDDISLLWLDTTKLSTLDAVKKLEDNAAIIGASGGEILRPQLGPDVQ